MPPDHFWFWAIALSVVSLIAFVATFIYFYRARIIEDTPTSKIRSAAQGYVELEGQARYLNNKPINARLSHKPCVWYRYKIERYVGGKHEKWRKVEEDESKELFIIKDDTGFSLVNPAGAKVTPIYTGKWTGRSKYPAPGSAPDKSTSLFTMNMVTTGTYRYTEERLHQDDMLYALGNFRTVSNPNHVPHLQQEVRDYLNRLKQDQGLLHKHFDANGDGQIDMQEWDKARETVVAHVKNKYQKEADAGIHLLEKPAERRHPYLLSAFPQDDLVQRYKRYSWLGLVGFFLAGGASVYMITVRLAA